jgi:serine/threonine protein kinase
MEEKGNESSCPNCGYAVGSLPVSALHLTPGTILHEKYLLGKVLGQGGFGITYLAWDLNLGLKLAIKEYFPQELAARSMGHSQISVHSGGLYDQYEYGMDKFIQEARMLVRFEDNPAIVSVRDYFRANQTAYLVMRYIEGITLKEYFVNSGGVIQPEVALNVLIPIMDALKELHAQNVLHRDISPDNIFINTKGQVVLIDFGSARQAVSEQGRRYSVIIKPGYAPEEQYRSKGVQGPWTDVYSLAATYYHMITGEMPPESLDRISEDTLTPPSKAGVDILPFQELAIVKALSVKAEERFQSVGDFLDALVGRVGLEEEKTPASHPGKAKPLKVKKPVVIENAENKVSGKRKVQQSPEDSSAPGVSQPAGDSITRETVTANKADTQKAVRKAAVSAENTSIHEQTSVLETTEVVVQQPLQQILSRLNLTKNALYGIAAGFVIILFLSVAFITGGFGQNRYVAADGGAYRGDLLNEQRHGYGEHVFTDGSSYSGSWINDKMHGTGIMTFTDGSFYEGEFKAGLRHGDGILTYANGGTYTGQWLNDKMHGKGFRAYADGSSYEGDFSEGLRHGQGKYSWPNGDHYVGAFVEGKIHGEGVLTFNTGLEIKGTFDQNRINSILSGNAD